MSSRLHRVLIPLAALLAVLPLLVHGPSCGHDFDFHLLNWLEINTQLHHLAWPVWAYTPAYNAGEPRFLFYPPLSWLLGAALTQILPFPLVPAAFTWIALTASGLALHRFAAPYASPAAATLAAVLYLANPYMLFTAYERTAYAELLAAAFLPLLFAAILAPRPRIPTIAIPLALLWLTNAPAAVMGTYALALLALTRLALSPNRIPGTEPPTRLRLRLSLTTAAGTTLGLALAAFYILPAAYERRFVQIGMAVIPGMRPADNFLFHHTGLSEDALAHDAVLHTASLIACLLLALTAASLLAAWRRFTDRSILIPISILTAFIALLLTPVSLPLWSHLPNFAFLQFPWRLLAVLAPILAVSAALAFRAVTLRPAVLSLSVFVLCTVLILPAWPRFAQPCDAPDTPQARAALYHSPLGTEPTDEYTPLHADPDALHPEDPPYWLLPQTASIDAPAPAGAPPGAAPSHLVLTLSAPATLVLNRRQYPLWRVELNHRSIASPPRRDERDDGLIAISLPAGRDTIDLTLIHTPDEIAGLTLSLLATLILFALLAHPSHFGNWIAGFFASRPLKNPANSRVKPPDGLSTTIHGE